MGAASCNIRSQLVFAMCLHLVFQNGTRNVEGQATYTDYFDQTGLYIIMETYPQLAFYDDPCVPESLPWIECSYNGYTARVTELNLGGRSLTSQLLDFSDSGLCLTALQIIDLHDNSLSGPIPAFLGNFYYLQKLDLSDNSFTGTIPSSLTNNKNLVTDFSGNPGLYTSNTSPPPPASSSSPPPPYYTGSSPSTPTYNYRPPPASGSSPPSYNYRPSSSSSGEKKSSKLPIILGIVFPALLISGVVGLIAIHKHKQRSIAAMNAAVASAQIPGISGNAAQSAGISVNAAQSAGTSENNGVQAA